MKKITEMKAGAKKQILSGMVYVALAVTVVAVTVGSVISSSSENGGEVTEKNGGTSYNGSYNLKNNGIGTEIKNFNLDTPVSDSPSGVSSEITLPKNSGEGVTEMSGSEALVEDNTPIYNQPVQTVEKEQAVSEQAEVTDKTVPVSEEPAEAVHEYGFDGFLRPCQGYIGMEFSMDIPVYSVSMYDYRTHNGIDIVNEVGTQVKAVSNGEITDIYEDYLYGTTVVISHKDGIKSVYSNLSPELPSETVVGKKVITGEVIAGIGESAMCEASQAPHLHLEMTKDGAYVDPEDYFVN